MGQKLLLTSCSEGSFAVAKGVAGWSDVLLLSQLWKLELRWGEAGPLEQGAHCLPKVTQGLLWLTLSEPKWQNKNKASRQPPVAWLRWALLPAQFWSERYWSLGYCCLPVLKLLAHALCIQIWILGIRGVFPPPLFPFPSLCFLPFLHPEHHSKRTV